MEKNTDILDSSSFLVRLLNDPELARLISDNFLCDIPVRSVALHKALEEKSYKEAEEWAHAIKGAALTVSAGLLARKALELEQLLKSSASSFEPQMTELDQAIGLTLEAMTDFKDSLS